MPSNTQKTSIKHVSILAALSACAVLFHKILHNTLGFIENVHQTIIMWAGKIFSNSYTGYVIEETIALLVMPLLFAGIITLAYRLLKRKPAPHTMLYVWIFWLVLATLITAKGSL